MPPNHKKVPGMLTVDDLRTAAEDGSIDTVIVALPDPYGKLMGKRLDASFFLTDVARGTHACDYLFTVDMEMEPVPGYRFSNWESGYGDVHLVPDLATLRKLSWLDRTVLVLCDAQLDPTHEPVAIAPRSILRKQLDRLHAHGYAAMAGSELEYFLYRTSYLDAARQRLPQPCRSRMVPRRLPPPPGRPAPKTSTAHSVATSPPPASPSSPPRANSAKTSTSSTSATRQSSKWQTATSCSSRQSRKYQTNSAAAPPSWPSPTPPKPAPAPTSTSASGRPPMAQSAPTPSPAAVTSPASPAPTSSAGSSAAGCTTCPSSWSATPQPSIPTSASKPAAGPQPHSPGPPTTAPPASASSAQDPASASSAAFTGADVNPYLAYAAVIASGLAGIDRQIEPPPPHIGDVYAAAGIQMLPATLEASRRQLRNQRPRPLRIRRRRRRTLHPLLHHRSPGLPQRRHRLGAHTLLRTHLAVPRRSKLLTRKHPVADSGYS